MTDAPNTTRRRSSLALAKEADAILKRARCDTATGAKHRPRATLAQPRKRARRHTKKISPTALRVYDGSQRVATIVLVGVDTVGTVEPSYVVLDQRDQRVGIFRSYHEALRAVPNRGRA
jgi:hypothetical protein